MIEVRKVTFEALYNDPQFSKLIGEYAQECSIDGMPPYNPHQDMYRAMEASGAFHLFGAYNDGTLVGFITMLTTVLPHYSVMAATIESIFVAGAHRISGAGMALLRRAEEFARDNGCVAVLACAPVNSRLSQIMPHIQYRRTNEVFFRRLD